MSFMTLGESVARSAATLLWFLVLVSGCSILLAPEESDGFDAAFDGQPPVDGGRDAEVEPDGDVDSDSDSDSDSDGDSTGDGDAAFDGDGDPDPDGEADADDDGDGFLDGDVEVAPDFIIYVDHSCVGACDEGTERSPFRTIEEALQKTRDGVSNIIQVEPGAYEEDGDYNYNKASRPISIRSREKSTWSSKANTTLKISEGATVEIQNLVISGKHRAIECEDSNLSLRQVGLVDGEREGLKAIGTSRVWMARTLIRGNGKVGVSLDDEARVFAVNGIIVGNGGGGDAIGGGFALISDGNHLELINCTIADNLPTKLPGAVVAPEGTKLTTLNLLLWNNTVVSDGVELVDCQECPLDEDSYYSGFDMPFVVGDGRRLDAEDYQLAPGSLAIGHGHPHDVAPSHDYWGDPRDDGHIDSGADEL